MADQQAHALQHACKELDTIRHIILQRSLSHTKGQGSSLLQTTRRLQEDIKQLNADKAVSRYRQLQWDLAESDSVNAALRKQLALHLGWQDAQVDQHVDEQVLHGERLYGASRELLMRENRRLRACLRQAQVLYSTSGSTQQGVTADDAEGQEEEDLEELGKRIADQQLHCSGNRQGQQASGRLKCSAKSTGAHGKTMQRPEVPSVWEELARRVQEALNSIQQATSAAAQQQVAHQHATAHGTSWAKAVHLPVAVADSAIQVELPVHEAELELLRQEAEVLKTANERLQHKLSWHQAQDESRLQEIALAVERAVESEPAAAAVHKQLSSVQHEMSALLQEVRQLQGTAQTENQKQAKELKQALADATATLARHLEQLSRQQQAAQAHRPTPPQQPHEQAATAAAATAAAAAAAAEAASVSKAQAAAQAQLLEVQRAALAASEGERKQLQRQLVAHATLSRLEDGRQLHVQRALLEGVSHALRDSVAEHCDALHAHLQQVEQQIRGMPQSAALSGAAATHEGASDTAAALLEESKRLRTHLHTIINGQHMQ